MRKTRTRKKYKCYGYKIWERMLQVKDGGE